MPAQSRIEWGHALTGFGLLVRRACAPLAVVALAALLFAALAWPQAGVEPAGILALAVAFALGRTFAVGLGALGWMVFPPAHRTLLAELAARAHAHR
jgi:hypothetical protein